MLGKIASAGQNGQFRTPRHIIKLMVEMTAPTPKDVICDPACGTAGFLIAASEHLVAHHSDSIYKTEASRKKFNSGTFHGYDFDSTMLRIGSMNMLLHGVENPDIRYRDSLAQSDTERRRAVHPRPGQSPVRRQPRLRIHRQGFAAGRQDEEDRTALSRAVPASAPDRRPRRRHRARWRALRLVHRPQGAAQDAGRRPEARRHPLHAVSGVFKPYAGVSTAVLLFTKTNSGGTDDVWFYDMHADGFSLDDKRTPQPDKSDLPDILKRWQNRAKEKRPQAHRPELPRPQVRDRRQRLRPLHQPLQGSDVRSRRTRFAEGDS